MKNCAMSRTGLSPFAVSLSILFRYPQSFSLHELVHLALKGSYNTLPATVCTLHRRGFGLFRVRSPLLAESRLISLPLGT